MLWARHRATGSPSWACFPGADPHKIPIDPNGNLTSKTEGTDTWGYEWNAENQLTRVLKNSIEQGRFAYDPIGRRVEKVAGGVTSFAYDHEDIVRELRGTSMLRYVHGRGIDEPLAMDDGTALTCLHADALGSVVSTTNASGGVTLLRQFDAWGGLELGIEQPGYAFTAREWDPETRLYYYRARYYDPKLRWMSEDPAGLADGVNLYVYVHNNPATFIDPSGKMTVTQALCIAAHTAAGAAAGAAGGAMAGAAGGAAAGAAGGTLVLPGVGTLGGGAGGAAAGAAGGALWGGMSGSAAGMWWGLDVCEPPPQCESRQNKGGDCYCMCGSTTRGGPYPHGRVKSAAACTSACRNTGYDYGFCK